jgi:hypothetical protein
MPPTLFTLVYFSDRIPFFLGGPQTTVLLSKFSSIAGMRSMYLFSLTFCPDWPQTAVLFDLHVYSSRDYWHESYY